MVDENNLSDYKYPVIVISVAVVAAIALGMFIGRPLWKEMQKTRAELKQKKEYLAKLEDKLASLIILKEREEEIKQKNAKVLAALPTDKDLPRLFYQFEQAANEAGVYIEQTSEGAGQQAAAPEGSNNLFQKITYQVSTSAPNYQALKNALLKYESALRLLALSQFDTGTQQGDKVKTTFELVTYKRSSNE